ncbi:MAG: glycosyltransferase [Dehalococcoidia bacterium]|jgi:trehalose synthase
MLTAVDVAPKFLESYRQAVLPGVIESIRHDARDLAGARVLHVNATAYGGGVAEILGSMVPLMQDLGLKADWKIISGTDDFFGVTKAMHNALQGKAHDWTDAERALWVDTNRKNAEGWEEYDFVVIHDPQPAPILGLLRESGREPRGKWLWRCHIDLTDAQAEAWELLQPWTSQYDGSIWTMRQYVRQGMPERNLFIAPPAIDPLSPKNVPIDENAIAHVFDRYVIDQTRPMVCQVSRFDPWKDPLGVIDAYRMAREENPGLQLVLVGSMAHDDPEGQEWLQKVFDHRDHDRDIHVLTNLDGVGNHEVNAFQAAARVVIQKSTREGFGLVVSEGLWKGRPVIGGNCGGIPLQVIDGKTGYLVDNATECGMRLRQLLADPEESDRLGAAGRELVREHFLLTRYLHDYVRMFRTLAGMRPSESD